MDKDKGTVYQKLNGIFNFDGFGTTTGGIDNEVKNNKVIIKGNSPEEVHRKGLELEQKRSLINKFTKTTDRNYQKALQYESARLPAYMDYEGMEYYPIISSALDLFMEEATTIGLDGKMLSIYSNKDRIKYLLEDFYYNILNVNTNLPFWTRNTCKYGDNFVLMLGERKKGITAIKQMVNFEIERSERIINGKSSILFKERMTGDEFNAFEIAHFRLLGDDKYIPYGSSLLNKVRRVFRQLIMAEDAMLTYRIIRAGEKKVFKIDVGNIDDDDIEEYMYKVATKFKKVQQVSPNDGQIDYRFNILGNDEDYFLPVRNANTQTGIETLPGATNLNDIHDIEYLRDNLFMGLGIPKPFLSFQDASGGGKNVSQFDIRFAKKVNRIQQAMVQELTKMGMIHLYLLGYSTEDFNDFTLTLTNPSTQLDIQKSELMREKSQTYTELTRSEGGIAAMSHTGAKRMLFNMTDREIVEDLKQQKMEKVIMQEFADAPVAIKKSGLFADIDKRYGDPTAMAAASGTTAPPDGGGEGGMPPPAGGGVGGDMPPINMADLGGSGLPNQSPSDLPPIEAESVNRRKVMTEAEFNTNLEKLVYGHEIVKKSDAQVIFESELDKSNKTATNMINEIDELISGDLGDVNDFIKDIDLREGK